ncbi:MAG: ethanolamine ammonia-lyase reactivating factor EutA [Lawsonibacter sp.]|nr:ethanolamine ammonia-lyase reactivating factor EutA [Lawsonibacter sp.]
MASILSVGIDIGTSTTQVIFSRIAMENTSGYFSVPKVSIVEKEVVYKSKVYLTPLKTPVLIDGAAVRDLVDQEYQLAGYCKKDVDTGAVIITGESARKENAAEVLAQLSDFSGEFVVSTAGPDLESIIAGKGSGAFQYSMDNNCTTVNLDIGGGTTNIVMFDCGETVAKGCLDIGGRLIRVKPDLEVEYVSPAAGQIAQALGLFFRVGEPTTMQALSAVTDKMADLLAQALGLKPQEPLLREVRTPESSSFQPVGPIRFLCFSGGVADCIGDETGGVPYGDIGVLLGRSIARGLLVQSIPRMTGNETIRATVVGAGTYTTSISGSTIAYAEGLLPMKNIPVLRLNEREQAACFSGETDFLREQFGWFLEQSSADNAALALAGIPDPDYQDLRRLATCLANEMDKVLPSGKAMIIILECDIAKALGLALREALQGRRQVICVDGVKVEQGDYVDLGKPVLDGLVIPLVVKTLLFG